MSDPAFLKFAPQFASGARVCRKVSADWHEQAGDSDRWEDSQWKFMLAHAELFEQAERHARLLAAVSEWANAQVPPVTFYAPGQLKEREQYHKGISYSQAHVRALLAQSEEQKR